MLDLTMKESDETRADRDKVHHRQQMEEEEQQLEQLKSR